MPDDIPTVAVEGSTAASPILELFELLQPPPWHADAACKEAPPHQLVPRPQPPFGPGQGDLLVLPGPGGVPGVGARSGTGAARHLGRSHPARAATGGPDGGLTRAYERAVIHDASRFHNWCRLGATL